jgi:hypothetical protein
MSDNNDYDADHLLRLSSLSDDDKFAILDDESHPDHTSLIDAMDPEHPFNVPSSDAPYGYMNDPVTGERRPRKRPGRQRKSQAQAQFRGEDPAPAFPESSGSEASQEPGASERTPIDRGEDRPPSARRGRGRGGRSSGRGAPSVPRETEATPFRAGPIAKGMNKLYRRVGKLVSMADPMIGQAFVDITRKDDEDDVTVGEAWEELARVNPRIRAALNKLLTGSGWGQLVMCHMPILLAVAIRTGVLERLNLSGLAGMVSDSDDPEPDNPFDGLSRKDWEQAASLAAQMMPGAVAPPFSRGV